MSVAFYTLGQYISFACHTTQILLRKNVKRSSGGDILSTDSPRYRDLNDRGIGTLMTAAISCRRDRCTELRICQAL